MDEEAVLCRVCLTTEDGEVFKPLTEEILKKVAFSLNVSITTGSAAVICRKCEADIAAAWRTCSRILDAHDYFESLQRKRKAMTKPATNTFDKCSSATFENRKSLGAHVAQHDSDCEIVESEFLGSFLSKNHSKINVVILF